MELNDLIEGLKAMLPKKVPYGDLIGAEGLYAHCGPLVYEDPEPYFIEQAVAELKKLSAIQDILGLIYDTDHLRELIQADRENTNEMTRVEVIQQLESLLDHCKTMQESGDVWASDCEALKIAIRVLRGKEET